MTIRERGRGTRQLDRFSNFDMMEEINRRLVDSFTTGVNQLFAGLATPAARSTGERERHRGAKDRCDCDCHDDWCSCQCCIQDADLVVYASAGERRVIEFCVENCRKRSRDITVELSNWQSRGGKNIDFQSSFASPTSFTLEACATRCITLLVDIGVPGTDDDSANRFPDVDDCLVAYADMRIEGCDIRPVRLAIAVLPRDCQAYDIDCCCGCC